MNTTNYTFLNFAKRIYPRPTIVFSSELDLDQPVVFVANHEKNYGPSIMQLFFPISYRPWIINRMLEPKVCSEYIREEFFEARLKICPSRQRMDFKGHRTHFAQRSCTAHAPSRFTVRIRTTLHKLLTTALTR